MATGNGILISTSLQSHNTASSIIATTSNAISPNHHHHHHHHIPVRHSTALFLMLNVSLVSTSSTSASHLNPSLTSDLPTFSSFSSSPPPQVRESSKVTTSKVDPAIRVVWLLFGPVIFVVGVCGNIFVLFIMTRKIMGGTSTCIHSSVMAVADLTVTLIGLTPEWFEICFDAAFKNVHPVTCKMEKFLFYTAADVSVWTLVVFTLDRYVAVCHPLQKKVVCTAQRARLFAALVVLVALSKNAHVFWTRGVQYALSDGGSPHKMAVKKLCGTARPDYEHFERYVRSWIVFVFVNVLPAVVIGVCNFFIVRSMFSMSRKSRHAPLTADPCGASSGLKEVVEVKKLRAPSKSLDLSRHSIAAPSEHYLRLHGKFTSPVFSSSSPSSPSPGNRYLAQYSLTLPRSKASDQHRSSSYSSSTRNLAVSGCQTTMTTTTTATTTTTINNRALVQMTAMCLGASVCFLVCNTPSVVLYVGREYWERNAGYVVFKPLYNIFVYVNHAVNFLLYCLTGQRFRRVFVDCLCRPGAVGGRFRPSRRYSDWGDNSVNVNAHGCRHAVQQVAGRRISLLDGGEERRATTCGSNSGQPRRNTVFQPKTYLYEIEEVV